MVDDRADRDLLFEALAVHLGFLTRQHVRKLAASRLIDPAQLGSGARPLGDLLVEQGALTDQHRGVLDSVANELLDRHCGDIRRCFDELSAFGRLRRDLEARRESNGGPRSWESGHLTVAAAPITDKYDPGEPTPSADPADMLDGHSFHGAPNDASNEKQDDENDSHDEWFLGAPSAAGMRFHVLRPHAQGGIGKVSVAFDAELQREVALKQIKPERADDKDSRSRFMLEAEVTGRLEHPGIVPVYGLGTDGHGRPYYAMRFVRGTSFEEAIRQFHQADAGRDARTRVLALRHLLARFADVCQTIAYAHSRGVLHRDLKPANVLLGPFNESLVVDWGLAKVFVRDQPGSGLGRTPAPREDTSRLPEHGARPASKPHSHHEDGVGPIGFSSSTETAAGTSYGTPAFMSPEQADGRVDQLGPASDVYSLGAMLYTLLCGRAPFEFVWCDVTALLNRVRRGDFPPPRKCNVWIPHALDAVCLKAMAVRPEDRYASASDLANEIDRWLADEPVLAYREPAPARVARWGRRHKPVVAGLAALLLTAVVALSAGIVLIEVEQKKTERQREIANAKSIEATQKAESLRRRDAVSRVNLAYREYLDDNVALADELLAGCPPDLHGWEWDYAHRLGHSELKTMPGSIAPSALDVWCVAFSPDGLLLAAGTGPWFQVGEARTGELVVRSIKTGKPTLTVASLKGAVQSVAFSPDGRHVAAAWGYAGKETGAGIAVFETLTGTKVWEGAERGLNIVSLAYSPDGRTIATACGFFNDYTTIGYARIRDAATGNGVGDPILGDPGGVISVAYSPDGRRLALASRGAVNIHDLSSESRGVIHQLRGHVNFVYAVAFSPDNRYIASAGWDKTIRLWNPTTGALAQTLIGHGGFVRGLAFSPDGSHLISGSEDKSVRRWDLNGGDENAAFHGHTGFVHCVAFSPTGALTASGSLDGTVKIWPAAAPDSQVTFRNSAGWVGSLAFAPHGRRVASAHNKNIRIWDPRTGEELARLGSPQDMLGRVGLTFSPDGLTLATGGAGGSIVFWDTANWTRRQEFKGHGALINDADFSADGKLLATTGGDGMLRIWNVATGTSLWAKEAHANGVNAVSFVADGRRVASAGNDHKAKVWEVSTGNEIAVFHGHATNVMDVAFSPDRSAIVTVGGAYHGPTVAEVKVWDSRTGQETASFQGHTSLVTAVAYFPDGRRIATASDDRTVKIWDVITQEDVFTLRGHTSGVVSLAVSRDGRQIVSGSIDYSARTWSTLAANEAESALEHSLRRAAVEHVQFLFARHLLKSTVLEAIRADQTMSPQFRAAVIEIAQNRAENASGLYEAAWLAIVRPTGQLADYRLAVNRLEAACSVVADDAERLAEYRSALALALVRAGKPTEALKIIEDLSRSSAGQNRARTPINLAVTAMAGIQLGHNGQAAVALDQLRKMIETGKWANDQQVLGFLHEAESAVVRH